MITENKPEFRSLFMTIYIFFILPLDSAVGEACKLALLQRQGGFYEQSYQN